ncbi:D-alanyl-D-alanine carboxypeptidase [Paenibacillus sp. DS2015]|uniref:serine hydrolase domain-containing protein n=1 Tax=Paenibacillus sp. DS2015 TaxID=3373917 RepID=UPI003D1D6FA5
MNKNNVEALMADLFRKTVHKDPRIYNAYMLVHSDKLGIHWNRAEGSTGSMTANTQQPYFIASIGKLFTAVLIGLFVEQELLSYEDTLSTYLDQDLLQDLHIFKGTDYTHDIQIKHLLNHTSGLNCFIEDQPKQGKSLLDLVFDEPSHFWTPQAVIQWSKEHLRSHFPPGKGFHYSDTGYNLLGLIIEKITSQPFHEVLRHTLFEPLEMKHSYLSHHSKSTTPSEYPMAQFYGRNINITDYTSLSISYAGGGIVSTNEDLLKFMKALVHHEILREDTLADMKKDWAKFFIGIDYGYGIMNYKTVPLFMPKRYNVWGNAGSTGTFMFYHPVMDTYLIGGLNHFRYNRKGIRLMLKTIDILAKCDDR